MKIRDKIEENLRRDSILKRGSKVLLCVSGGLDSTAMLLAFASLEKDMGLELVVAHLNHKLRGKDSDGDEKYVKELGGRFKLKVVTEREDVKAFAKAKKLSLEDAARRLRYSFFARAGRKMKADAIVTAHTKDDQAETVLMRIMRGAGLKGLRGIPPKRRIAGIILMRPLINISRQEIEDYLKQKKIKPRIDSTNQKSKFFRNKVRLKLLPFLEKNYNPRIKELLFNLAELVDKDYEYLDILQQQVFKKIANIRRDSSISFRLRDFKREHISVQRALVRTAIKSLKSDLDKVDYRHWKEVEDLIENRPTNSIVDMPGGIKVIRAKTLLRFYYDSGKDTAGVGPISTVVKIPGITDFGGKRLKATVPKLRHSFCVSNHPSTEEYFDIDKLRLPLSLRFRQPGDRMTQFGMKKSKKISDIFIDDKVPIGKRGKIPLVVSSTGEIAWLAGMRMSNRYKISPKTKKILKLELSVR